MNNITASTLKIRGVAAIRKALNNAPQAIVSVHGKDEFVVMDLEHYQYLRECELTAALAESRADVAADQCTRETVDDHLARLDQM